MRIPRMLFRVKTRDIEAEARHMLDAFGIDDVEVRRDDTIADAWLEDYQASRTVYGLQEIEDYLAQLTRS